MRLSAISSYIPQGRVEAEAVVRAGGGSAAEARVFRRLFGVDSVACADWNEPAAQQFVPVLDNLAMRHTGRLPQALIYVHGIPLQFSAKGLQYPDLRGTHRFLASVERCYEVDQYGCSGLFWALHAARMLLESELSSSVVILAGDSHAQMPLQDRYVQGCTLMGDAFCGLVLDLLPGGTRVGDIVLQTHPEFSAGRTGTQQEMGAFFAAHSGIVRGAMEAAGFNWSAPERPYPHNVNTLAWEMFCRDTGLDRGLIDLGLLPETGHCYTTDPFILFEKACVVNAETRVGNLGGMLLSVGMGGFVGACRFSGGTDSVPHHFVQTTKGTATCWRQ